MRGPSAYEKENYCSIIDESTYYYTSLGYELVTFQIDLFTHTYFKLRKVHQFSYEISVHKQVKQ